MLKKLKSVKIRFVRPSLRAALLVYAVFASTFALVILAQFVSTYQAQQKFMAEETFKSFNRDFLLQYYERPHRSTTEDRIFFPQMHLSIPATEDTQDLLYAHFPAINDAEYGTNETAIFASKPAIYNISSNTGFACHKLADITFNKKDEKRAFGENRYVAELKLEDGRMMYIYQNTNQNCTPVWQNLSAEELVGLLKQAKSYKVN